MRESGPLKRDEEGDEDGDVDEDDHRGDGSPGASEREGERVFHLGFLLHGLPLDGERFSLWSLASMVMMAPSGILHHGLR